jgi:N-methylhydantoinase B
MLTRMKIAPRGLFGGADGKCARVLINGRAVDYTQHYTLTHGDKVLIETAGGGGFGER